MKLMSLFDGSGGFGLAGAMCGITPMYASEIEPYPIAVTTSRFPNMKHLGSVTDIKGNKIEPVDVITFGSPCFPAGTQVFTKAGYKPIEQISVGDIVCTHTGNWKRVSAVGHKESPTVKLTIGDNTIVATPNHPFYSAELVDGKLEKVGGWTPAEAMRNKYCATPTAFKGIKEKLDAKEAYQCASNAFTLVMDFVIPAEIYCAGNDVREAVLRGLTLQERTGELPDLLSCVSMSKRVAYSVGLLGQTLGYEAKYTLINNVYKVELSLSTRLEQDGFSWNLVNDVEPYSESATVYNITVDGDHSYIVEGLVVHNCQDLSVAGKRAGLKHEDNGDDETTRSGLFMEAIRIIKEMREATNGAHPRFAVWENVPGAFSSNKGEDFRTVLEEFIKINEPSAVMPPVPQKGWAYADCFVGDGWSVAYRTLDAQYWGVPQRRRRIYLVADFRGECAGKILFEREGLRGYFEKGRTPWQETACDATGSTGTDDREGTDAVAYEVQNPVAFAQKQRDEVRDLKDKVGALQAEPGMKQQTFICGRNDVVKPKSNIINLNKDDVQSKTILDPDGIAPALYAGECRYGGGECYVLSQNGSKQASGECITFEPGILKREGGHVYKGVSGTLRANAGDNQLAVVHGLDVYNQALTGDKSMTLTCAATDSHHIPCVTYGITCKGNGEAFVSKEVHSTLASGCRQVDVAKCLDTTVPEPSKNQGGMAIVEKIVLDDQGGQMISVRDDGKSPTLRAECHGNVPCVLAKAWNEKENNNYVYAVENHPADSRVNLDESGTVQCLTGRMGTGGGNVPMVMEKVVQLASGKDVAGCLMASGYEKLGAQEMFSGDYTIIEKQPVYCLQGNGIDRADTAGCNGRGWKEDASYTLNTIDRPAVVYELDRASFNQGENVKYDFEVSDKGIASPLVARGPSAVACPIDDATILSIDMGGGKSSCVVHENLSPTLTCTHYGESAIAFEKGSLENDTYQRTLVQGIGNEYVAEDKCIVETEALYWDGSQTCGTLTKNNAGGNQRMPDKENFNCVIEGKPRYIVRRLTPTECARLQGFPDEWMYPDHKEDFTDEEYKFWLDVRNTHAQINGKQVKEYTKPQMLTWYNKLHTDSSAYKMWGNGIALPNALYVMQGIADVFNQDN